MKMMKMDEKALTKFNFRMSLVLLVLFVVMFVSVTLAYFSDTSRVEAVFTAGNVKIALTESQVKRDAAGNLVKDPDLPPIVGSGAEEIVREFGMIYPGMTVFRDPTVENIGDEAEWLAAKVTVYGDVGEVLAYPGYDEIDIGLLLSGGLLEGAPIIQTWNGIENAWVWDDHVMFQAADKANKTYEFYFLMLQPVQPEHSVTVFDTISFSEELNGTYMQYFDNLKIRVQAYGVQTSQLGSCFEAMTRAFPEHFEFS